MSYFYSYVSIAPLILNIGIEAGMFRDAQKAAGDMELEKHGPRGYGVRKARTKGSMELERHGPKGAWS